MNDGESLVVTDVERGTICVRCVMDGSDPEIRFDRNGQCNHCLRAEALQRMLPSTPQAGVTRLEHMADAARSKRGEYDCILGISGGVDSSYVGLLARRMGLRVLAVHFDNGWNSEVAVSNIERVCEGLGHELVTYVVDWPEFRDLQRSFLLASVIDVEMVTDQAIFAAMVSLARTHKIRHVLSGTNLATEAILPDSWRWPKQDLRNLRDIHGRYGTMPLSSYPTCGMLRWGLVRYSPLGLVYDEVLNAIQYRRLDAEAELAREVGWRTYGGKHEESVFTRFYQRVLLPEKFGVDKRRAHLSSLIVNGEIEREDAIRVLEQPPCTADEREEDIEYVGKKLGFTQEELEAVIQSPPVAHAAFASSAPVFRALSRMRDLARRVKLGRASTR